MKLKGIFPPITTPFDHNGNIYASQSAAQRGKWNRTSLSGYVVMGSTGESVILTTEEKLFFGKWWPNTPRPTNC